MLEERTEPLAPQSQDAKTWDAAVVGAGYVGVPLAHTFAKAGRSVLLIDVSPEVVDGINRGVSHIIDVPSEELAPLVRNGQIRDDGLQRDPARRRDPDRAADAAVEAAEPDLSIVISAAEQISVRLRNGHLVVLESTTYPRTTREVIQPILESTGLKAGRDFHLAFSPERVDPGNGTWTTKNVPKVVGGITPECTERAAQLYEGAVDTVHRVSTPEAAELTKLLENIYRSVNIALVNELAQLCERMEIDVWEVIEAAATKPFGFMSFQPGPGLGGHCIPIDPFYLTWKAREYDFSTEFIELAGKVNENMPYYCRSLVSQALNHGRQRSLSGAKVLVLGVAYKSDIGDTRESPAIKLIELLRAAGAEVSYHDPHVAVLPEAGLGSVPLEPSDHDCVVIVTAHSGIDYDDVVERSHVVVDLRNATGQNGKASEKVWKL